jgi:hypothetical protein
MDNIKELEKRWYFYKAKQSLLSLNTVGLAVMFSLGSYYAYTKVDVIKNLFNEKILVAQKKTEVPKMIEEAVLVEKLRNKSLL